MTNRQTALCLACGVDEMNEFFRAPAQKERGWVPLPRHLWQSPSGELVHYVRTSSEMQGYTAPVQIYILPGAERRGDYDALFEQAIAQRLEIVRL